MGYFHLVFALRLLKRLYTRIPLCGDVYFVENTEAVDRADLCRLGRAREVRACAVGSRGRQGGSKRGVWARQFRISRLVLCLVRSAINFCRLLESY